MHAPHAPSPPRPPPPRPPPPHAPAHAPGTAAPITVRDGLDFGLDGDIPRHWLAADAFKSRFFDAMSVLFPEGERFFIACVRDYKDALQDPAQQQAILDFARQEAQHSVSVRRPPSSQAIKAA